MFGMLIAVLPSVSTATHPSAKPSSSPSPTGGERPGVPFLGYTWDVMKLARAIEAFLANRRVQRITGSYDLGFDDAISPENDFQREATRQALICVEWDRE